MNKLTILHTIETGGPGGAESILLFLASGIDKSRFRSLALVPYEGWLSEQLKRQGIPYFVAQSSSWHDPHLLTEMTSLIRREKVDLMHSHLADQNFYSCIAGYLTRTRTIATYHGTPGLPKSKDLRSRIKLWTVRNRADAVVVVSDFLKKVLIGLNFPPGKITRIYNGVDMGRFAVSDPGRFRDELGCRNGTKLVGMVANFRQAKGYEYFVKAARKVADANPHVRFIAVGQIDRTIAERMRQLVVEMSLQDRFLFLGFRQDVPAILAGLDLFVLSSVTEGFSLATVEAMAAGKPVIATRSGGPEEIIDDGSTGILVPPADADALAEKICELLGDRERASQLAAAGRAKAAGMFSLEKMIAEYEVVYNRLLNGK